MLAFPMHHSEGIEATGFSHFGLHLYILPKSNWSGSVAKTPEAPPPPDLTASEC